MQFKALAFIVALTPAAMADFIAYCGGACANDGAGCPNSCIFLNKAPESCDEVLNSVNHIQDDSNDATKITRLKINNSQVYTPSTLRWGGLGENPHFTIYDLNGVVEIRDTNDNVLGNCIAAQNPMDEHECFAGISSVLYVHAFDCFTTIEYLDSPN